MNHWMFRCQDISRKISQAMDTSLPLHQRMAIRIHLMMCRYCSRFHRQLHRLRRASRLTDISPPTGKPTEKLPDAAKARIKEKLRTLR